MKTSLTSESATPHAKASGLVLLEIGAMLMAAGAATGRIRLTINRLASVFGYKVELLITHRSIIINLSRDEANCYFDMEIIHPQHIDFQLLSGISRMSWRAVEEQWTVEQVREDVARLRTLPRFSRTVTLLCVAMAGAAFCKLAGGTWAEVAISFVATGIGLWWRQRAMKLKFNFYLGVFSAAAVSSILAHFFSTYLGFGDGDHALATSVLFLIPGVQLINSFSDFLDGNLQNGLIRAIHSLIVAFAIALGMVMATLLFGIK